jgi:hypothetical protein
MNMKKLIALSLLFVPQFVSAQGENYCMMGGGSGSMVGWGFLWFILVSFVFSLVFWLVRKWLIK